MKDTSCMYYKYLNVKKSENGNGNGYGFCEYLNILMISIQIKCKYFKRLDL